MNFSMTGPTGEVPVSANHHDEHDSGKNSENSNRPAHTEFSAINHDPYRPPVTADIPFFRPHRPARPTGCRCVRGTLPSRLG